MNLRDKIKITEKRVNETTIEFKAGIVFMVSELVDDSMIAKYHSDGVNIEHDIKEELCEALIEDIKEVGKTEGIDND